ncbi:MAG TPA: low specificity L-threonine aldolase [Flavipsychrobacter sp.]|nr:low specificity L-threonine aldolase [Flavipsychrobacter sp.]
MKSFASDNYAGVLPEIMEALQKANHDHAISYGNDTLTNRVRKFFKEIFEADVEVLFVLNGTGANVLSISSATQTFNSVLCADISHFYNDESSAPETFTGCRFFPITSNQHGKLDVAALEKKIIRKDDIHFAQPQVITVTQSTEYGTVYTPEHLSEISTLAKDHDLYFHVDGSRFFNAAARLNCSLKEISTDVGIDILSLGGTKLGMMYGEAVVVFNKKLAEYIFYKQKQVMQLASKTRFIAAQYEALLKNDLWKKPATHANLMAKKLCEAISKVRKVRVTMPVEANVVFAILPHEWIAPLQQKFPFYVWNESTNEVRLMCSFDNTEDDINDFSAALSELNGH